MPNDALVMIALDDLGSGLPSFAYLKDLQVDFLKIDGMFVKDIDADSVALAIVRSKNEIGQVMGKQTIAPRLEHRSSKCQYELRGRIGVGNVNCGKS